MSEQALASTREMRLSTRALGVKGLRAHSERSGTSALARLYN